MDKALLVPAGLYLITFDIICFTKASFVTLEFRRLMMSIVFYYFGAVYVFQGIYHWFHPIPSLIEDIKAEEAKALEEQKEAAIEAPIEEQVQEENEKPE